MARSRAKKKHGSGYRAMRTGNIKAEVVSADVDNPYFQPEHFESPSNPKTITALVNIRESAVETLFARGQLDKAQKRAADRFRGFWEAMGGAGAKAMDYTREYVDGGRSAESLTDRQINAGKELMQARSLLGARNYDLVCKICGEGFALDEICRSKREKLTAADNLRSNLNDLAAMWGMLSTRRMSPK